MKISQTPIGREALSLGDDIQSAKEAEAKKAPAPAQDTFASEPSTALQSQVTQLQQLLEQVRTLIGEAPYNELKAALPKGALAALEIVQPALALEPGQSAYAAYKAKTKELLAKEEALAGFLYAGKHDDNQRPGEVGTRQRENLFLSAEKARAEWPGYAELQKQVSQLQAHLSAKGSATEGEV